MQIRARTARRNAVGPGGDEHVCLLARDIEGFSEGEGRGGVDICRLRAFATMADLCHRVIRRCVTTTMRNNDVYAIFYTSRLCVSEGTKQFYVTWRGSNGSYSGSWLAFDFLAAIPFPWLPFHPSKAPLHKISALLNS